MTHDPRRPAEREPHQAGGWVMLVHLLCCGLPIIILALISAGLTVELLRRLAPYLGVLGVLVGLGWFIWYVRRRCWTCSVCDRNTRETGQQGERSMRGPVHCARVRTHDE